MFKFVVSDKSVYDFSYAIITKEEVLPDGVFRFPAQRYNCHLGRDLPFWFSDPLPVSKKRKFMLGVCFYMLHT